MNRPVLLALALLGVVGCYGSTRYVGDAGVPDGDSDADSDADADADADDDLDCPEGVVSPSPELCGDGVDNDCDGVVDEGCPVGPGECLCIPGARRWCEDPVWDLVGEQACSEDGLAWGPCGEGRPPERCREVDPWFSPEVERCLIEVGGCVQDFWDLDGDGDAWESLGDCTGIVCPEAPGCADCGSGCRGCEEGEWRYCDTPDYSRFGTQECSPGGDWGQCLEAAGEPECSSAGSWYSPEWESCCIDRGWCCQDMWDLDGDGDVWESLGRCGPAC